MALAGEDALGPTLRCWFVLLTREGVSDIEFALGRHCLLLTDYSSEADVMLLGMGRDAGLISAIERRRAGSRCL